MKACEGAKSNKKHPSSPHCTVIGLSEAAIPEVFYKKALLKKFTISTGNTCVEVLFKNVPGMNASNFIKKRSQNRCFLEIICERLLFDFFNGSLLHGPKGSRSRLHDSVRLQGLTHRSSFLFLSVHEPNSPHPPPPPPTCVRKSKTNTFHESIRFLYWLF